MQPDAYYKLCKFCENHARDTPLWGIYIPKYSKILVKFSVLGVLYPYRCTDGGAIRHGGVDRKFIQSIEFHPKLVQHVAPAERKTSKSPSK